MFSSDVSYDSSSILEYKSATKCLSDQWVLTKGDLIYEPQ
jgi:hypothetical protein